MRNAEEDRGAFHFVIEQDPGETAYENEASLVSILECEEWDGTTE